MPNCELKNVTWNSTLSYKGQKTSQCTIFSIGACSINEEPHSIWQHSVATPTYTPTRPGIQSYYTSVYGAWKKMHKYIKARTILALTHNEDFFFWQAYVKQNEDMVWTSLYTPYGQNAWSCNMPQSEAKNFDLKLCQNVLTLTVLMLLLYLDLALNASANMWLYTACILLYNLKTKPI